MHIAGRYHPLPLCAPSLFSNIPVFCHPEAGGGVPGNKHLQQHVALCIVRDTWRGEDSVAR